MSRKPAAKSAAEPLLPFGEPEPPALRKPPAPLRTVLTVSQVTARVKGAVESALPAVWIEGELSNFKAHTSGHLYFCLKDESATLAAVMFRSSAERLRFRLRDGMSVVAYGRIGVYEPRGQYQLYVDRLEPKGVGALDLAFRQLCERLRAEGLFDPARKRPLPFLPRRVALVTSPTGAAVADMLQVIAARFPRMHVLLYPVRVQGEGSAIEVAAAIDHLNRSAAALGGIDVMIVGRGGGSLEDLWAFNEECVARAIHRSAIPVVSAVGHETDVTVADFVADRRALTPTEAAGLVVPVRDELDGVLDNIRRRLVAALGARSAGARRRLEGLLRRRPLADPAGLLRSRMQQLDEAGEALRRAAARRLATAGEGLAAAAARLEALSPLAVLGRGYAIAQRADGRVLRRAADAAAGEQLRLRLGEGELDVEVRNRPC